mgnify:CR=1 FL=1
MAKVCCQEGCQRTLARRNQHGWCRWHYSQHRTLPRAAHVRAGHARARQMAAERAELETLRRIIAS